MFSSFFKEEKIYLQGRVKGFEAKRVLRLLPRFGTPKVPRDESID